MFTLNVLQEAVMTTHYIASDEICQLVFSVDQMAFVLYIYFFHRKENPLGVKASVSAGYSSQCLH